MAWQTDRRLKDKIFLASIVISLSSLTKAFAQSENRARPHRDPRFRPLPFTVLPIRFAARGRTVLLAALIEADPASGGKLASLDRQDEAKKYAAASELLIKTVRERFGTKNGDCFSPRPINAVSLTCLGSAFAVYAACHPGAIAKIARYFQEHYQEIIQRANAASAGGMYWQQTRSSAKDTYQNGGYWRLRSAGFIYTLDLVDPKLADQTLVIWSTISKARRQRMGLRQALSHAQLSCERHASAGGRP